jgi:hypothetical protein
MGQTAGGDREVADVGFAKNDPNINRKGRPLVSQIIGAVYRDLAVEFPDLAPPEAALLRIAATLLYRGERCRDSGTAHKCATEARKIISTLRAWRAAAAKPALKPPTHERLRAALAGLPS